MDMANKVSVYLGLLDENIAMESRKLLSQIWKNVCFPKINTADYMKHLFKDKKNIGNNLNLILTKDLGDMFMKEVVPDDGFVSVVHSCLTFYRSESAIF